MSAKEKPLDKTTVKELRDLAKGMGAEGVSGMKKEELLDFIRQAKPAKPVSEETTPAAEKKAAKKAKKKELTVKQLKKRIITIKAKRAEALEKGDRRMATIYKRQISRLKKKTRRAAQLAAASGK
jgi:hypothetical protein